MLKYAVSWSFNKAKTCRKTKCLNRPNRENDKMRLKRTITSIMFPMVNGFLVIRTCNIKSTPKSKNATTKSATGCLRAKV